MSTSAVYRLPAPIEAAAQRVRLALRQAVERSIESLGLAALSAGNVAQRSELLAAQFELDRKSATFILAFDDSFTQRLRHDCSPREDFGGRDSNWAELTLVDDHEVDVKVAAERFGLQMSHACEWELRELSAYLGSVLARDRFEANQNPLRPELIGLAMIRAAEAMTDRVDLRRGLVAEIGRSLGDSLGPTYAAIVADLRASGIQPTGMTVRTTEGRATDARRSVSGAEDFAGGEARDSGHGAARFGQSGGSFPHGAEDSSRGQGTPLGQVEAGMMHLIRRLAFADAGSSGSGAEPGGFAHDLPAAAGGAVAPNLIHTHREELRAASRGAIDHMVIDVIGSLFDQILSDPKVPPQMARQIARLQLPVLRAALGDPSFFSSRRHPVRRFVNRIASVGSAIDDFADERGQSFLAKVRELVQEVVQGDFEQIEIYERKLAELETFVAEQARAEVGEQGDAAALLQEKEDQLRLHRLYSQQLSGELRTLAAPEFLREFIAQVWSQVLLKAAALSGAQGDRVLQLRQTGRDLFMSVQPKVSALQRKTFLAELPKLMQSLNAGMDLIAWPDAARRSFFGQLLPAHADALKNTSVRTLDYNLLAKRVEGALERPLPSAADLKPTSMDDLPVLSDEVLEAPFNAEEARRIGLVKESAVDWNGKVDIDLSAEPELSASDTQIEGLPATTDAPEPMHGKSLADHVQIGFAYQMHLQGQWEKVRLAHVSPVRTFFVFTHGKKHKQTISLTHRMLVRLCETGRMRAFENAYLIERATARARRQLAELGARAG